VHDVSDPDLALDKGMVFVMEPGLYLPEENFGIRIEDVFWVNPNGKLVRLNEGLPRTANEVEKAMAQR
jgi:Xaa-Pro aminopeptidase